jgi:hypothetical protein
LSTVQSFESKFKMVDAEEPKQDNATATNGAVAETVEAAVETPVETAVETEPPVVETEAAAETEPAKETEEEAGTASANANASAAVDEDEKDVEEPTPPQTNTHTSTAESASYPECLLAGVPTRTATTTNPILAEGSNEVQVQAQADTEAPGPTKDGTEVRDAPTSGSADPATQDQAQPPAEDGPNADAIQIWAPADPDVLSVSLIVVSILCIYTVPLADSFARLVTTLTALLLSNWTVVVVFFRDAVLL